MPVKAKYESDFGVVVSVFSGHVTLWDLKEDAVLSFIIGEKHQTNLFLADVAGLRTTDIESADIHNQTRFYDDIEADRAIKVAIVLPPTGNPVRTEIAIFETTFVTQGWNIRTFEQRPPALKWLLEKA